MRHLMLAAALAATTAAGLAVEPAAAQSGRDRYDRDYRWHGDRRDWDAGRDYRPRRGRDRRMGRDDQIYRGRDNRYYCRRNNGTTGLVVGGLGGGLAGNLLGGGTLGTLLGAGGGALLGRSIDRGNVRCR